MDRAIDRRDFLNGVAVGDRRDGAGLAGRAVAEAAAGPWPQDRTGYYPPILTGMRGIHPGTFRERPQAARRRFLVRPERAGQDTGETYDLVVVGGGISGLAAATSFAPPGRTPASSILDNHDDFGGHAKRNEFHLDGKLHLLNGGTLEIDSPFPYSPAADGLLKTWASIRRR